jgi:MoaA/NifB/PqqE/SkfB family radical SAM enzyme
LFKRGAHQGPPNGQPVSRMAFWPCARKTVNHASVSKLSPFVRIDKANAIYHYGLMGWHFQKRRRLTALQVEVTSRCTRHCRLCPRDVLAERWQEGDLGEETWSHLEPHLALAEHVHLQGWGEPLLHSELPYMVRTAKAAGCAVGVTTNGDLLETAIPWLVEAKVDLLTVSVAGNEEGNRVLRGGASLRQTLSAVSKLAKTRKKRCPRLQVSYLLTRENHAELPRVLELAAKTGVDEVFAIHLDCTPDTSLLEMAAFTEDGLRLDVAESLEAAQRIARRHGLQWRPPAMFSEEPLVCALDPQRFAYVRWDGNVGPCAYLMLPIAGRIPRATFQGRREVESPRYGNLTAASLPALLESDACRGVHVSLSAALGGGR